jgi:hypothetical protein
MQNNRNPKFTIFIHHFHLNHGGWIYVEDTESVVFRLKVEEMRPMDVMLMEYLTNVDMDILEQDKRFMQIFTIRYLALGL